MTSTGWLPEETPAAAVVRNVDEFLSPEAAYAQRQELRREQEAEAARQARRAEAADRGHTLAWMADMLGRPQPAPDDVVARQLQDAHGPSHADLVRRQAARKLLREHGLEGAFGEENSGVIFDANIGVLEPRQDASRRAALEEHQAERQALERSNREAEKGSALIARMRARRAAELSRSGRVHAPGERVPVPSGGGEIWRVVAGGGNQAWQ